MLKKLLIMSVLIASVGFTAMAEQFSMIRISVETCPILDGKNIYGTEIDQLRINDYVMAKQTGSWWKIRLNNLYKPEIPDYGYIHKDNTVFIKKMEYNPEPATFAKNIVLTDLYERYRDDVQYAILKYAESVSATNFETARYDFQDVVYDISNNTGLSVEIRKNDLSYLKNNCIRIFGIIHPDQETEKNNLDTYLTSLIEEAYYAE